MISCLHSWLIIRFATGVYTTCRNSGGDFASPRLFFWVFFFVRIAQSLLFCVVNGRSLLVVLSFFPLPLHCLYFVGLIRYGESVWHICFICRNHNQALSPFMNYHQVCNKSNTVGSTCGAGTQVHPHFKWGLCYSICHARLFSLPLEDEMINIKCQEILFCHRLLTSTSEDICCKFSFTLKGSVILKARVIHFQSIRSRMCIWSLLHN